MPPVVRPYSAITNTILAAFFDVYNALGSGFREIVYERALAIALAERGLRGDRQEAVTVWYHGQPVGTFRADLIVDGKVLIELKALPGLGRRVARIADWAAAATFLRRSMSAAHASRCALVEPERAPSIVAWSATACRRA